MTMRMEHRARRKEGDERTGGGWSSKRREGVIRART